MALASYPARPGKHRRACAQCARSELGVGALAKGAEPGMSPVGVLSARRVCSAPLWCTDIVLAEVALLAEDDQAAGGQFGDDIPDPRGGQVTHGPRQRLRTPT